MATIDISRRAFDPRKHYAGVRMQQGRVLTDNDYNEGARIHEEEQGLSRIHVIGSCGSPDDGFRISSPLATRSVDGEHDYFDFRIEAGTFYVGGLRLCLETKQSFRLQADWLRNPWMQAPRQARIDLVYLEAWQQPVSAVEDEELFEVALGGPDTTTRLRNMARVRVWPSIGTDSCIEAWSRLVDIAEDNKWGRWNEERHELIVDTRLTVDFEKGGNPENLCTPFAAGGYLGAENQAIRVQLVDRDHFTWGFDNGAPLYRVKLNNGTHSGETEITRVTMLSAPKDQAHWPVAGQVVEILPWSTVLPNGEKLAEESYTGQLSRALSNYDPQTRQFMLSSAIPPGYGHEWRHRDDRDELLTTRFPREKQAEFMFMRVWDRGADRDSPAAIPLAPGPVALGATGVRIMIDGEVRRSGNYRIITARPETPDLVLRWDLRAGRAPDGIRRFYVPLALIHWGQGVNEGQKLGGPAF